jgi:hypothetical protein
LSGHKLRQNREGMMKMTKEAVHDIRIDEEMYRMLDGGNGVKTHAANGKAAIKYAFDNGFRNSWVPSCKTKSVSLDYSSLDTEKMMAILIERMKTGN